MGEISELMRNGTICKICGVVMDDLYPEKGNVLKPAPGYPRMCDACKIQFPNEKEDFFWRKE